MATEEQKKANLVRVYMMTVEGLVKGLWDLFGEGAYAAMETFGDELLEVMQKEMGLEIGGENVHEEIAEVGRLFVDEFGFADKIELVEEDKGHAVIHVDGCHGYNLTKKLRALGIEHPFTCPIMNVMRATIHKNLGLEVHEHVDARDDVRGSKITFKFEG
ncbi:hypothetical protein KAX06_00665 [candidate division WOR-3 bacterium]|nr:hypothetical protein [candidate division WOR-3 bacterium]